MANLVNGPVKSSVQSCHASLWGFCSEILRWMDECFGIMWLDTVWSVTRIIYWLVNTDVKTDDQTQWFFGALLICTIYKCFGPRLCLVNSTHDFMWLFPIQTAQRRIREIIQQVKQQEQKHQQGTSASAHPSKWPAGRLQRAPANECSPPERTENYPDNGRGQRGHAGQTSNTNQNQRTSRGGKRVRAKGWGHCVHCQPRESR